jgi:bifunctional polynucleotide phosphatase/kinase
MTTNTVTRYVMGISTGTKSAGFDLDGTLFLGTSNIPFPGALEKLKSLISEGYNIIIISNQLRLKDATLNKKIDNLAKYYQIPMEIYVSRARDQYRKPEIGILSLLPQNLGKLEFYVGDAANRANDFSDSDLKFAENAKIPFFTPEEYFANIKSESIASNINSTNNIINTNNTMTNVTSNINPANTINSTSNINFINIPNLTNLKIKELDEHKQLMIIMVGYSASGKSSISKTFPVERINQDELKTKAKCISQCKKLLASGKSVVIDKTNPSKKTRAEFIAIAEEYKIPYVAVHIATSFEESLSRNQKRATETGIKAVPMIAYYKYRKDFEEPSLQEGFLNIYTI